jgi:hypothetical protein
MELADSTNNPISDGRNSPALIFRMSIVHFAASVKLEFKVGSLHAPGFPRPYVMALFKDGADSFSLPLGSTLEELADRIDGLGERHAGAPVAIQVQFDRPASPRRPN